MSKFVYTIVALPTCFALAGLYRLLPESASPNFTHAVSFVAGALAFVVCESLQKRINRS